jgi:hypothetical protein
MAENKKWTKPRESLEIQLSDPLAFFLPIYLPLSPSFLSSASLITSRLVAMRLVESDRMIISFNECLNYRQPND